MTIKRTSMKERIVVSGDGFLFYWNSDIVNIGEVDNYTKKLGLIVLKNNYINF